jgi:hypothetical protein
MFVLSIVHVYEDINKVRLNSRETSCVMDMDDCKLGFTHLRLVQCNHANIFTEKEKRHSISSFLDPLHPIGTKSIP